MGPRLGALLAWLAACPVACLAIADVGDLVVVDDAGAGGSAGAAGVAGAAGMGGEGGHSCASASECPEIDLLCEIWICPAGSCELADAPQGTSCSDGDRQFCDDSGQCVECLNDAHCGSDYCDRVEHTCQPRKPGGATCDRDGQCLSGNCQGYNDECAPE